MIIYTREIRKMAEVIAVCISKEKGTPKYEIPEINIIKNHGVEGDAHAGDWT